MKFFIDTADIKEIREAHSLGLVDGVTTNPALIAKSGKATKTLHQEGIKVNVTLVFSAMQALLAAKAGATYVSPFVGRLDDISQDGMSLIEDIRTIFDNYGFTAEIIVASVRNPVHVLNAALLGADVATIPYGVIMQLAKHPLTDAGIKKFLEDWEKVPQ